MPEIPEIASRAQEMNQVLLGKVISTVEIIQPKSINLPVNEFAQSVIGTRIEEISYHGKWLFLKISNGWILINMGMGGELLYIEDQPFPAKFRVLFEFSDTTRLCINFWWFGYVHFVNSENLSKHEMTAQLGPNVLDLTQEEFVTKLHATRGKLKTVLLDQSRFAGIGNAYIHDILFLARLHPLRAIDSLSEQECQQLFSGIHTGLELPLSKNGAFYELTLFGEKGGFQTTDMLVAYKENQPCPNCGTPIQKIKTGSTSSFICPSCQPEMSGKNH